MNSVPGALTRTVATLLLAALPCVACDGGGGRLASENPAQPPSSEPPNMPPAEAPPPPPLRSDCRWQGYGIGLSDRKQCNTSHLLAHAADQCFSGGGEAAQTRVVTGTCASEAEEVQIFCCPTSGPAPEPASPNGGAWLDGRVSPAGASSSRTELTLRAEQECARAGKSLGDWSALYAADGVSAELLRFGCH